MKTRMTSAQRAECVRWLTTMSTHAIGAELIHGPYEVAAIKPYEDGGWYVSSRGPTSGSGAWHETRDDALAHAYRVTGADVPEPTLFEATLIAWKPDIVDDLHAAEDHAAQLEAVLRRLLGRIDAQHAINKTIGVHRVTGFDDAVSEAQRILADRYCRPSCHGTFVRPPNFTDERGMVWEGEACDPDCGCPCGHET